MSFPSTPTAAVHSSSRHRNNNISAGTRGVITSRLSVNQPSFRPNQSKNWKPGPVLNSDSTMTSLDTAATSVNVGPEDFVEDDGDIEEEEEAEDHSLIQEPRDQDDDNRNLVDVDVVIQPGDSFWTVYLAFYFLGITTLLPWNFFINADKYWMYKFRDVTNSTNMSLSSSPHGKTEFQASFTSYLAIASNVPSTLSFVLNVFLAKWISTKVRMLASLALTFAFFVSQTVLVRVDTDHWQYTFFIVTMVTVVLMNSFCTLFQCGLFATIGKFPHNYTTATMSGQALGGIFAAVANIISIVLAADQTTSAFIYFTLGSGSLLFSFVISTFILPRMLFYKFHTGEKGLYRWIENYPPEALIRPEVNKPNSWAIFKKVWMPTVSALMTFLVTLAAFPTLIVLVVSDSAPSVWNDKYLVPVVSFLVFAIGDYFGRIVAGATHWPNKDSYWTLVLSAMRLVMIPMLMMCNLHPRLNPNVPIVFGTDLEFGAINYIFGFGNGYLTNIVFINAPQLVNRDEQEEANGIVTMGLGVGLSLGVTLSYFVLIAL